jgi:hypothetical protein
MHLFTRIAAAAAVTFAPFAALSVAAPDIADASSTTAAASSSCSGSPGHGFFDASTGRYVTVDGNLMVANSPVDTRQWNVYYDNQPASPEYREFALCNAITGRWVSWELDGTSIVLGTFAVSPWTNPEYSFFLDPWCGRAPDGKWLMDFLPNNFGWATTFQGHADQMEPSTVREDWFTGDGMCGVP